MPFRPALVRLHRWAGLTLAGFLMLAGLTGAPLAFRDSLDAWLNPALFDAADGAWQPAERWVAAVQAAVPGATVQQMILPDRPGHTVRLRIAAPNDGPQGDEVFVDPVTARVRGRRDAGGTCLCRRELMGLLLRVHYTLAAGPIGQTVMGGAALIWIADCFVGLCLTLPAVKPFWRRWAGSWRIKPGANGFRLVFDLHRAAGLWCWLALLILASSAAALTLPGVVRPALALVLPFAPPSASPSAATGPDIGFQTAMERAQAASPGREPAWVIRSAGAYAVALRPPGHEVEAGLGPDWVTVAADSGAVLRREPAWSGMLGDRVWQLQYPLHSGQIAGLPGRILVCALGLLTAGLAGSGVWLAWRKHRARRRARTLRAKAPPAGSPPCR